MNVIIVNESTGKGWIRTRRIISRYCPQIGSNTWVGHLSEEGLHNLHEDLKKIASKSASVACHRVDNRSRTELAWIVGSRACFNEEGRYAFRHSAINQGVPAFTKKTPVERFATAITKLAALFHDIGKASIAFQNKLAAGQGFEMIRHDLMSFLVLAQSLVSKGIAEEEWLASLVKNPASACSCVSAYSLVPTQSVWLARVLNRLTADQGTLMTKGEIAELNDMAPGLLSLLWLVLSHHRLPEGDDVQYEGWDAKFHINKAHADSLRQPADVIQCLAPHPGAKPWDNAKWQASVAATAKAALEAKRDMDAQNFTAPTSYFWATMAAQTLRPVLMLSDHVASIAAVKGVSKKKAFNKKHSAIYANLVEKTHVGDTLAEHLIKTAHYVRKFAALALTPPTMPTTTLPPASIALKKNPAGSFAWQNDIEPTISQAKAIGPVFTVIAAETGAGKTIAATRVMHALDSNMRSTVALGLRELTRQAGESMVQDMGISKAHVKIVIGQPQTLGLADKAAQNMEDNYTPSFGSESAEGAELDASVPDNTCDLEWLEKYLSKTEINKYWKPKHLAFNATPITICTADHLVAAVNLLKGGDAKLFLRLATADLVLDEIDAYSAQDLQSIGKVIYTIGAFGHNVTLLSATLTPEIKEGLFNAWRAGVAMFCARKNKPLAHASVFLSNVAKPMVLTSPTFEEASAAWSKFTSQIVVANDLLPNKTRKLAICKLLGTTIKECYQEIEQMARILHSYHAVVDEATGKRITIGYIRLNTAKSAWKFGKSIATRNPISTEGSPDIRFVTYHSKMNRSTLGATDAVLRKITNRKHPTDFLTCPYLRKVLDTCTSKDVIIIVVTTTLIETGRDFDFDWAILEPRSVRGEVQAGGRVRRHRREGEVTHPNVIILDRPLKALNAHTKYYWAKPGVEDSMPMLKVSTAVPEIIKALLGEPNLGVSLPSRMPARRIKGESSPTAHMLDMQFAINVLPITQWEQVFDARMCLQRADNYETNRIGYLEAKVQFSSLMADGSACINQGVAPSLNWYLNSFGGMNAKHARKTPFRGNKANSGIFIPTGTRVEFVDEITGERRPCLRASLSKVPNTFALIHDLELQANKLATGDKHVDGAALSIWEGGESTKELTWDPLLGFLEEFQAVH